MKRTRRLIVSGVALAAASMLVLTGCTPGSETAGPADTNTAVETDVSKLGDLTLRVWDQEVRGGQNEQIEQLNKAFMEKYPNVKIERNSQSFEDLGKTLRLALTGDEAPDVVQANNARNSMGQFVSAGQLVPLDKWADAYKWDERFSESVLNYTRYSDDAVTFGEGSLFGLPQVGEVVGVFYSKPKLAELGLEIPEDWSAFESALQTAKDKGETPLLLGNVEKWPGVHVFGPVQGANVDAEEVQTLGFGNPGASWETPENEAAAQIIADWGSNGFFNDGVNGTDYDDAWQQLAKGDGVFLIGGSWLAADLEDAMGDDVGFFTPPVTAGEGAHTTGGTGLPFAVTSGSKNQNAAAAYIDFITNEDAMQILADTGNLPVVGTEKYAPESGVQHDVYSAFGDVTANGVLLPYLDYATPTFADTLGEALQRLLDGKITPKEFTAALEADYADFVG